ncbi:MAG: hypothetical protein A3H96_06180 [Acidobacteria bacterium RIFCSPLOWO2_02_FULL_67_36]|nr:MAG: hypothetical protein A3H96_06180 [Acidobacteria bacterium RIFCSPLOWO2_02_FULL_67_36]OFW20223.1 MAG: hypothetical protein A3G21_26490 [Acidobacteria bacterium RIFCSPLOWO2_12_FULL_66_21]
MSRLIRVGISACLLGQEVRYDGGHTRDPFLADVLGQRVTWVPVCPEVEAGLGTPREPVDLVKKGRRIRMVGLATGMDYTATVEQWTAKRLDELEQEDLDGYVLKSGSPSCGVDDVRLHHADGATTKTGRGVFAHALMRRMPSLPVEHERRLQDPAVREQFIERVHAYHQGKVPRQGR